MTCSGGTITGGSASSEPAAVRSRARCSSRTPRSSRRGTIPAISAPMLRDTDRAEGVGSFATVLACSREVEKRGRRQGAWISLQPNCFRLEDLRSKCGLPSTKIYQVKQKALAGDPPGLSFLIGRLPTLPHTRACSTIGAERLNFRVRDGNGWDPLAEITRSSLLESSPR